MKNGVIYLVIMRQEDLSITLKCCAQTMTNSLLSSADNTKKSHF